VTLKELSSNTPDWRVSYLQPARAAVWEAATAIANPILLDAAVRVARTILKEEEVLTRIAAEAEAVTTRDVAATSTGDAAQYLFLDRFTRRLRAHTLRLPHLSDLSRRERAVLVNPTRLALRAAIAVGAVTSDTVIRAIAASDAQLLVSSLGLSDTVIRGRIDLVAVRRFGIPRAPDLRPRILPPAPLTTSTMVFARLHYLLDELEYVWLLWERTGDWRLPEQPVLPLSHRDARAVTSWSATVLDARLARGSRWDRTLDTARIRTGPDIQHEQVVFDARRFVQWWVALSN
jgi:hypothetical protein